MDDLTPSLILYDLRTKGIYKYAISNNTTDNTYLNRFDEITI